MKIISGNSNIELSKEISEYLKIQLSEVNMTSLPASSSPSSFH